MIINNFKKINNEVIENFRFIFLTDDLGSGTSVMKAIMPANAIRFYGGVSLFFDYTSFLNEYIHKKEWTEKDVIILTKFIPGARVNHFHVCLDQLKKIKKEISHIFCEASEELSFDAIENYDVENDLHNIKKIFTLIDGYFYETVQLHNLIQKKFKNKIGLFTRHPHSNCTNFFNPYSPLRIDTELEKLKNSQSYNENNVFNLVCQQVYKDINIVNKLGYIGRAKYCHNFTMLMRACYEASHKLGRPLSFHYSNSGTVNNLGMHYENLDLGIINLYRNNSKKGKIWFDYKASSKILCMWSLGIPVICSPLPSYVKVMEDCGVDVEKWTFLPSDLEFYNQSHSFQDFHEKSIQDGRILSEKIFSVISDNNFEKQRKNLFIASYSYNPINIGWLYEEFFDFLKNKL